MEVVQVAAVLLVSSVFGAEAHWLKLRAVAHHCDSFRHHLLLRVGRLLLVEADPGLLLAGLSVMGSVTVAVGKNLLSLRPQDLAWLALGCKIVDWLGLL